MCSPSSLVLCVVVVDADVGEVCGWQRGEASACILLLWQQAYNAHCRRGSSAMPTMRGLGLTESCMLARDIGYKTNKRRDLPRFGALDEVKPLLLVV
jgi:hypothetical protein